MLERYADVAEFLTAHPTLDVATMGPEDLICAFGARYRGQIIAEDIYRIHQLAYRRAYLANGKMRPTRGQVKLAVLKTLEKMTQRWERAS